MKTLNLVTVFFCLQILSGFGQIASQWVGGYPGRNKDWNCAANWSNNKVPNEFTDVTIVSFDFSNTNYPEICSGVKEVHSLVIRNKASLSINSNALLVVHREAAVPLDLSKIHVRGSLKLSYQELRDVASNGERQRYLLIF